MNYEQRMNVVVNTNMYNMWSLFRQWSSKLRDTLLPKTSYDAASRASTSLILGGANVQYQDSINRALSKYDTYQNIQWFQSQEDLTNLLTNKNDLGVIVFIYGSVNLSMIQQALQHGFPMIIIASGVENQSVMMKQVDGMLQSMFRHRIMAELTILPNQNFVAYAGRQIIAPALALDYRLAQYGYQLYTAYYHSNTQIRAQLKHLFGTHLNGDYRLKCLFWSYLEQLLHQSTTPVNDQVLYHALHEFYHTRCITSTNDNNAGRSKHRVQELNGLLQQCGVNKITSFLDVGCAEGNITASLAQEWQISNNQAHGCDVRAVGQDCAAVFVFTQLDEHQVSLPYQDNQFDVVCAMMSLHHMKDVTLWLKEIHRVVKTGGLLLIREHDVLTSDKDLNLILDLVHGMYAMVWSKVREQDTFITYYATYRAATEWNAILIQNQEWSRCTALPIQSYNGITNPYRFYAIAYRKVT